MDNDTVIRLRRVVLKLARQLNAASREPSRPLPGYLRRPGAGRQLGATDDCGFSPFSIDEKPNHGSPDFARETAWQKISSRVEGTRLAAEKLGVG